MLISSCSSRISVCSGRSPGSTLPPGNSHNPARVLPSGRCAISTRLSTSTSAQATTRVSMIVIPGCATWRRPGIHTPRRGYGFRARSFHSRPQTRQLARRGMTEVKCELRSRPVIAVDRNVFLGEVAGQHAVAAFAEAEPDLDLDLRVLHRPRYFRLVIGRIARATAGDADAVERDRELVAVGGLAGLADRHHHAAPIGILAGDRGLHQ